MIACLFSDFFSLSHYSWRKSCSVCRHSLLSCRSHKVLQIVGSPISVGNMVLVLYVRLYGVSLIVDCGMYLLLGLIVPKFKRGGVN